MGEGVLTKLLRIVYEIFFSNAPVALYFAKDFLTAGTAVRSLEFNGTIDTEFLTTILPSLTINNRIKRLSFENLNTDSFGCNALSKYIRENYSLKRVGLPNHQIDFENLSAVLEAISVNQSIDELYIYSKNSIHFGGIGSGYSTAYSDVYTDLLKIRAFFNAKNRKIRVKL